MRRLFTRALARPLALVAAAAAMPLVSAAPVAADSVANAGDFAVLPLAQPLPVASVIGMAGPGDPAYAPGTAALVYGWGDVTGAGDYARSLRAARVRVLPDTM